MDKLQEYMQSYLDISLQLRNDIPEDVYNRSYKHNLDKLYEFLSELEKLPAEVDYTSENDILRLRAYIKEALRRNKELEKIIDNAIYLFLKYDVCTKERHINIQENCEGKNCKNCFVNYLKNDQSLPF